VTLTLVLGYLCAIPLPHLIGVEQRWGVVGLTASSGVAAWLEFVLLRRSLNRLLGWTGIERLYLLRLWAMALAASAAGIALKFALSGAPRAAALKLPMLAASPRMAALAASPRLVALAVIAVYAIVYLGLAWLTGEPELQRFIAYASRRPPAPPLRLLPIAQRPWSLRLRRLAHVPCRFGSASSCKGVDAFRRTPSSSHVGVASAFANRWCWRESESALRNSGSIRGGPDGNRCFVHQFQRRCGKDNSLRGD